jgi:DNA sulfur modification protein DndD
MRARLLIKKIEINNCGGFDGSHSIELSGENDKNFTIILGLNGRGKSTLFQLTHWCLYGKHYEEKNEDTASHEGIINLSQLDSLQEGEKITGKITLRINNQDGEKYVLERTITAEKLNGETKSKFDVNNNSKIDSGIQTETNCKLKMKDRDGNDVWEKNEDVINMEIGKHLPRALKDFFLFDGENLVNFRTKSGSSRLIRDGIEKISGLNILDSLIADVKYTHKKISSSLVGKTTGSKGKGRAIQTLESEIDDLKKSKLENEKTQNKKSALLEQTVQQIGSSAEGKRIEDLIDTQDGILKSNRKNQKINESEIYDFMFEKLPLLLISDTLRESEHSFGILEKLNLIPPSITREALDKIFNENTCVCGRDFKEHDDVWKKLNEIKKSVLDKDTTSGITPGRTIISQMIDGANMVDVKTKYDELLDTASELDRIKITATSKRAGYFTEQQAIKGVEGLDYDELIQLRKDLLADLAGLHADIRSDNDDIISKTEKLDDETKKYNIQLAYEGKHEKELAKQIILKAVEKYSNKKRQEIVETLLIETEKSTGLYFKQCAPQASEFALLPPEGLGPVKISSNYDIIGINSGGKEKNLSKGQAHALGLSYVSGCRKITSSDTFLFIDSPLHNISGDARNEVAEILSTYLPDVQIVLFVTDTEYLSGDTEGAKPVREYLNPTTKVWKEYEIKVTCTECAGKVLYQSKENRRELVCKNCNKIYDKKNDPTGPRLIMEYDEHVR